MRTALRNRLTDGVATDIHLLMRGLWDNRAATAIGAGRARSAHALREAAYHGVRAGQTSGAELLDYTDRAVRWGGHTAAAGMTNDLHAWLTDHTDDDLATTLRCLNTEAAVRLGDASTAIRLTPRQTWAATGAIPTVVGGRLAVAAGQGRRIAGHTAAALTIFTQVWEQGSGTARRTAGLWAADLHMCQGRFTDAEILAAQLDAAQAGADDREFRADVARLRHLAGRFAFDLDASRRYLDEAEAHYTAADSVLGLANIQTNRAELLAMTDPTQAIIEAGRALEIQAEIGAHHELGKAYTALAVGQLRTGRLAEAGNSLQSAFTALDRAGYRSGRARAELYQGLLLARLGRLDEAVPSLLRAVAELEAAHVYPTLILAAACALDALGLPQDDVNAAARRARATIQPIGSFEETDRRIAGFVDELLDGQIYRPADLHRQASERADSASGFYNHNVRLSIPAGDVIVRIPIPDTDTMDLSIWPEPTVLRAIRDRVPAAPRLLYATDTYATDTPPFQIHEFKAGELLDNVAPRGVRVPGHVIDDVVELLHILGHVSRQRLPPPRGNWPADAATAEFARRLSSVTSGVHRRFLPDFGNVFHELGIPANPLTSVLSGWSSLRPRPFQLLHTDIHRKNMIVDAGRTYFLDWELALWGDPVYDLAVHVHKMAYQPDETNQFLAGWLARMDPVATDGWEPDLATYLAHERVKSAIVDTVRYTKLVADPATGDDRIRALIDALAGKLAAAHLVWNTGASITPDVVEGPVRRWSDTRNV
ncbi:aminoglycoside phosphotransferase [Candidatus Protofrankia californiensis]|uniref:Aminoglycoside phosphotransferase n=1 Tax=Candidatus Protofrankia californiensis TaxID=1839754 RepID=A0A1C3NXE9_9ACTN|nr:aminoglycoside phosphotransferase [Candidatus Protofrankia californiensis]